MLKRFCFFSLMCCIYLCDLEAHSNAEIEGLLNCLDSLIERKGEFSAAKERKIALLYAKKSGLRTLEEQYWNNKSLYEEYFVYKADSAMLYVNRNLELAEILGKSEWIVEWNIKKSFLLAATGLLAEALYALEGIDASSLPQPLQVEFYGQLVYLYSHFGQYLGENYLSIREVYLQKEHQYTDSVYAIIHSDDPLYLWYKGWKYMGTPEIIQVAQELKVRLDTSMFDTRHDAMESYLLSRIYRTQNQEENYLKYIIRSAMADIRIANGDIASLEELAFFLFKLGDIDRAYTYINYCLQNAQMFHNRVRVAGISKVQNAIHEAYLERNHKQEERLHIFLVLVSILSVILLCSIIYIYRQMKHLSQSRFKLDETNHLLNEHVEELSLAQTRLADVNEQLVLLNGRLKEANGQLRESNYVKEEYIGYVFAICSNYISKLNEFRKNINRKAKTGQYDDIIKVTSGTAMAQNELKEFYHNFDAIFLHVYPDFVTDFNALLHPDERIVVKEGDLLNTDLRIYALVRLGISDSVKIAEFLHCSPQTVYNIRLKIRNKAIIPKENFAKVVSSLGKMQC